MLGNIISAAASIGGGLLQANNAKKQMAMQKEFAQNQLQWKAADAEKAGISKYFAMGAPTASYSPVSVGDYGLGAAGQAIASGIPGQGGKGSTTAGKISGISSEIAAAQLDGLRIDNDIKRAELASKIAIATQPGAGGSLDTDVVSGPEGLKLKKEVSPSGYQPQKTFGVSPEVDWYRTKFGYEPVPPQQLSEVHENNAIMRWAWMLRNYVMPFYSDDYATWGRAPAQGHYWSYIPGRGYVETRRTPGQQRLYDYGRSMQK